MWVFRDRIHSLLQASTLIIHLNCVISWFAVLQPIKHLTVKLWQLINLHNSFTCWRLQQHFTSWLIQFFSRTYRFSKTKRLPCYLLLDFQKQFLIVLFNPGACLLLNLNSFRNIPNMNRTILRFLVCAKNENIWVINSLLKLAVAFKFANFKSVPVTFPGSSILYLINKLIPTAYNLFVHFI